MPPPKATAPLLARIAELDGALRRVYLEASNCRQYMMHLGWCGGRSNSSCTCERDADYAGLMKAQPETVGAIEWCFNAEVAQR